MSIRQKKLIMMFGLTGILLLTHIGNIEAGNGVTAANFMKIATGARAIGLGEAFVSVADDATALYWNPAGLCFTGGSSIVFSYNRWMEDISHGFVGINTPPHRVGTFGIGATYLHTGDIDAYDESDNRIGTARAQDMAFMLGYGMTFVPEMMGLGVTYTHITQELDTSHAQAGTVNVGVLTQVFEKHLRIGANVENISKTKMKFEKEEAEIANLVRLGASYRTNIGNNKIILSAQHDIEGNKELKTAAGMELELYKTLSLRGGYNTRSLGNGFMGGFGIKAKEVAIDYAITDYGEFGYTHIVSLTIR